MEHSKRQFTEKQVVETLQLWCDNVVLVGKIHSEGGDVISFANKILSDNYDYDNGKVLFKPTLSYGEQTFRPTKEGALAYFVGGNSNFPNDKGFKLKPWVKVWFSELDYILNNELAIVQCNIHLTAEDNSHIFVNKSIVFKICKDDKVRIILHQSSIPYNPNVVN